MIRLFLLVVAISSGIGAIWMALASPEVPPVRGVQSMSPVPAEPVLDQARMNTETREVLIAARDLRAMNALVDGDLAWALVDVDQLSSANLYRDDAALTPDDLLGKVIFEDVVAGTPLRSSLLQDKVPSTLSYQLRPGMRAVSISVAEDGMAGGFILPGDRVDIHHVMPTGETSAESRVLAKNVQVIALDQKTTDMIKEPNYVGQTATMEVKAGDVASVVAATQLPGKVTLVLRSRADVSEESPSGQTEDRDTPPHVVRFIRNGQEETVVVP